MTDKTEENEKKEEEVLLTEQEVWDVISFARELTGMSYLSPSMINARMKQLNLNPRAPTASSLEKALQNPKEHEKELREYSQDFELNSMVYKRLITYLSNMLSFDITYVNDAREEEYGKPRFEEDARKVEKFLDGFDYRKEFKIATREMLRNEAYFGIFRDLGNSYVLQELPPEHCKITGRWSKGFLFSFDMSWFDKTGVDIEMYPSFFKEKKNELNKKRGNNTYKPSISAELRGKSSWSNWVDIPITIGVCFKLSPELTTRLPYFSPLFNDLILQGLMRNLQKNINMASANKLVMGEVPFLNKEIKATVRDSLAISPKILGKFMYLVKSALSDSVKVGSLPLNDIKGIEFEGDNDLYDKYLRTALASSGINTNLIFSSSIKPNAIETQLSLDVDEQMMKSLYEQFEDYMNYIVKEIKKTRYNYFFSFEGTDFSTNRQTRINQVMTLFDKGIVLPQKIAAAYGMKPHHFMMHMKLASSQKFIEMLTPPAVESQRQMQEFMPQPMIGNQQPQASKGDKENNKKDSPGRPQKELKDLGEEGAKTRETASNVGRGGIIK